MSAFGILRCSDDGRAKRQLWAVLDRSFSNENAQLLHYLMVASSPKRTSQDFGQ